MNCLKCGRDTNSEQVFCNTCLQAMEAYPVRPDVPIHLPTRSASAGKKQPSRKKTIPLEEQILQLKATTRRMRWIILVLVLALSACIGGLVYNLSDSSQVIEDNVTYKNYTYSPN